QRKRGPQPREAAADDHDVRPGVRGQRRAFRAQPGLVDPVGDQRASRDHASDKTSPRMPVISSNSALPAMSGGEIWTTGSPRSSARQISPRSNSAFDRNPRKSDSDSSSENDARVSLSLTSSIA